MQRSRNKLVPTSQSHLFHGPRAALLALAAVALVACGGGSSAGGGDSASESDNLNLTGTVKADSSAEKANSGACEWTPAVFSLKFSSGQMQNSVQVRFNVTVGVGGVGDIDAAQPAAADGSTPLQLVSGGKTIAAKDGTVHVTSADLTAKHFKGSIEGSFVDGTQLSGSWSCTAS